MLTPEQLVAGGKAAGERVVVYDTDGYYMGATMAEALAAKGTRSPTSPISTASRRT